MDLLSAQDWADFRGAIKDVRDTFFDLPVTILFYNEVSLSNFNESKRTSRVPVNVNLLALNVPRKTDDDSQADQMRQGFMDDSEGYCLFHYPDLLASTPALIVGGQVQIKTNRDTMKLNGEEVVIIAVNLVGPTEQDFQLVKIQYKRKLNTAL